MSHHIKFITDSTCDLPKETLEAMEITALPLHVLLGQNDYLDGVNITRQELYDYAAKNRQLPKTAAVGVMDFVSAYQQAFDQGYEDIIYLGISGGLSSTYQNAMLAREEAANQGMDKERIHPIDSQQLSTGIAQLLYEGQAMAEKGMAADEIVERLEETKKRSCTSFIVDTLEYLHMGGRCSSVVYVAGSMLKIHPQISMKEGKLGVGDKFRGNLKHCLDSYEKKMVLNVLETIEPDRIFITHTLADPAPALEYKKQLEELGYFRNVYVTEAGATISSHCGPGTLGFLYIKKA